MSVFVLVLGASLAAAPQAAPATDVRMGPVNGRLDQVELLPLNSNALGGATVGELATIVGSEAPDQADPAGPRGDLPSRLLVAYRAAADRMAVERPRCHLPWSVLAGIGKIESGQAAGRRIDADGVVVPTVLGPRLDGSAGVFLVRDTDGGWLDGDTDLDRPVGLMQFTPSAWRWAGRDADGDGTADPDDVDDAALSAAEHLCRSGDLWEADRLVTAVRTYNPVQAYVRSVLAWAAWYALGPSGLAERTDPNRGPAATAGTTHSSDADAVMSEEDAVDALERRASGESFEVTELVPVPASGGCPRMTVEEPSVAVRGLDVDTEIRGYEALAVTGRVIGAEGHTMRVYLALWDAGDDPVTMSVSVRALPAADELADLGRLDGGAIAAAADRGPFRLSVQVMPPSPECPPPPSLDLVAEGVDAVDFAGAEVTLADLRERVEMLAAAEDLTDAAADDLLAQLPDRDGGLRASVELGRFVERLSVAANSGDVGVEAAAGLRSLARGLMEGAVRSGAGSIVDAAEPPADQPAQDVDPLFDVVPLIPRS